jgi:hypothetical protein
MDSFTIKATSMGEVLETIARSIAVDDDAGRAAMDEEKALLSGTFSGLPHIKQIGNRANATMAEDLMDEFLDEKIDHGY